MAILGYNAFMVRQPTLEQRLRRFRFPTALRLLRSRFPKAEVYAVGGSVRDQLLGRPARDLDFVIRNVSYDQLAAYFRKHGTALFAGRRFGVLKFRPKHDTATFDIALPRLEHSLGLSGGYRDFIVRSDPKLPIEDDLNRRDFTVNALAWDLYRRTLIDPTGGLNDLAGRRIRAVGDPALRFREDYSRLLRALRFSIELRFTIEDQTWQTLKRLAAHLIDPILPRETVAAEIVRMLDASPLDAIDALELSGALRVLIPETIAMERCDQPKTFHREGTVWTHGRLAVEAFGTTEFRRAFPKFAVDTELVLTAWLHDIGKPFSTHTVRRRGRDATSFSGHEAAGAELLGNIAERLKLSSAGGIISSTRVRWLIRNHLVFLQADALPLRSIEKFFLNPLVPGEKLLALMFADTWASELAQGGTDWSGFQTLKKNIALVRKRGFQNGKPHFFLDGNQAARALKIPSGPAIGRVLEALRVGQLDGQIVSKAAALAFVRKQGLRSH